MAVQAADYVVIGVHKISLNGDVSNKIGSLTIVVLAKTLQLGCKVVVVFEIDKVTRGGDESKRR